MTVHQIIKRAVERLKLEGKLLTPDEYAEAFCLESKKAGILQNAQVIMSVECCDLISVN